MSRRTRGAAVVERDARPEDIDYKDEGCWLHPACLSCPFPDCIAGAGVGWRSALNQDRDAAIRAAHAAGLTPAQIGEQVGMSARNVYRVLYRSQPPPAMQRAERNAEIARLVAAGVPPATVAAQFSISRDRVYRIAGDGRHQAHSAA